MGRFLGASGDSRAREPDAAATIVKNTQASTPDDDWMPLGETIAPGDANGSTRGVEPTKSLASSGPNDSTPRVHRLPPADPLPPVEAFNRESALLEMIDESLLRRLAERPLQGEHQVSP